MTLLKMKASGEDNDMAQADEKHEGMPSGQVYVVSVCTVNSNRPILS